MEPVGDIDELALVRELRSRHNTAVATFLERYRPLPFALARDVDVREARAAGEPDSLGVVVFKVES